jgi:xylulokinase
VSLGTITGALSPAAVRRLSELAGGLPEERLPPGIPIIAGGADFIMALIGTGAIEPGMVCDRAGSSEGINRCTVLPGVGTAPQVPAALRALPHVIPGLWNISVIIPSSGRLFERYRVHTGQEHRGYDAILAERIPGGILDPAELGQAVLMSMGFEVRAAVDTLDRHGFPVTGMRLSGGQSKNRRWNQLKADITGTVLQVPEQPDGELAGDAVLGAIALGEAADLPEGIGRIVHIREQYTPDAYAAAVYRERFQTRRELRDRIGKALGEVL